MTFFYTPDARETIYTGPYAVMDGQPMSAAYASVMRLSFEVQSGLLMRQVHHWTALVFLGAIAVHLCRIFFTGAFRRPREINWLIGIGLLLLALGEGITGYSLPGRPPVRARGSGSSTRSCCRSRSSARGSRRCSSAASSRRPTS